MEQNQTFQQTDHSLNILFARQAAELLSKDQVEEAIQLCERGVKLFPYYAEGHHILARAYQAQERFEEARAEYERTLFYMPNHLQAQKGLAYIYFKEKQRDMGNQIILNHALYDPRNPELIEFLKSEGLYDTLYRQPLPPETKQETEEPFVMEEAEAVPPAPEPTQATPETPETEPEPELIDEQLFVEETPLEPASEESTPLPEPPEEEVMREEPVALVEETETEEMLEPPDQPEALSLGEDELIEMPIEGVDENRADVERDTLLEELSETAQEQHREVPPIDLDQFKNTEDDFSTLMGEMFEGGEETADEESAVEAEPEEWPASGEPEAPAEEKPILDTTVIFNESRQETEEMDEKEESAPEAPATPPIATAADLEAALSIADSEQERIEEEIEKTSEPPAIEEIPDEMPQQPTPEPEMISEQAPESVPETPTQETAAVEEVLERVETSLEEKTKQEKQITPPTPSIGDEEAVNIEEILENPSLLTPTFGEILIAQKKFDDARRVFQELLNQQPDNERFKKKLQFLDKIIAFQK